MKETKIELWHIAVLLIFFIVAMAFLCSGCASLEKAYPALSVVKDVIHQATGDVPVKTDNTIPHMFLTIIIGLISLYAENKRQAKNQRKGEKQRRRSDIRQKCVMFEAIDKVSVKKNDKLKLLIKKISEKNEIAKDLDYALDIWRKSNVKM